VIVGYFNVLPRHSPVETE